MKKSDLKSIIKEELINVLEEIRLNEAFADPNIRKISKMRGMDSRWDHFWTKFAKSHDIAWDKLPSGTLNKVTNPSQAKKGLSFWVVNGVKDNPFHSGGRSWSYDRTIGIEGRDSVIAVTLDNKIQYFGNMGVGAKGNVRHSSSGDAVGLGVRGTLQVKKLAELADDIYVMDFESFRGGTKALKAKRAELKLGKDKFKDARAWRQANMDRYRDIMNARVGSRDTVDAMVAKIVKMANEAVAEGMELMKMGKYDELQTTINGNEVPMNAVTSAMSRALRSYAEYIRYENDEEKSKEGGYGSSYYGKSKKETAGYIKKILQAFEQGNANNIGRY